MQLIFFCVRYRLRGSPGALFCLLPSPFFFTFYYKPLTGNSPATSSELGWQDPVVKQQYILPIADKWQSFQPLENCLLNIEGTYEPLLERRLPIYPSPNYKRIQNGYCFLKSVKWFYITSIKSGTTCANPQILACYVTIMRRLKQILISIPGFYPLNFWEQKECPEKDIHSAAIKY